MQTKRSSAIEAVVGTGAAILLSLLSYQVLGPLIGLHVTWTNNFTLTAYFTALSFIRTYCVRRIFNNANVRSKVQPVPTHMGSIQSLRRTGGMSFVPKRQHNYVDATDKEAQGEGPL